MKVLHAAIWIHHEYSLKMQEQALHGLKPAADSFEAPGYVSCLGPSLGFCPSRWGAEAAGHALTDFGVGSSCPAQGGSHISMPSTDSSHWSCTPAGQPLPAKIAALWKGTDDGAKAGQ